MIPIPDRYPVESILIESRRRKAQPLVTVIHGGPHGQIPTAFTPAVTAYALQGCTAPHTISLLTNLTGHARIYCRYIEYSQLHGFDRVRRFLRPEIDRKVWNAGCGRRKGYRGSPCEGGKRRVRSREAVRNRWKSWRLPYRTP